MTGAGSAFCAGADLSRAVAEVRSTREDRAESAAIKADGSGWSNDAVRDGGGRLTLRIFDSLKPVIAAVNGAAVGVGVTMQLAMDVRLASETRGLDSSSRAAASTRRRRHLVSAAPRGHPAGARMELHGPRLSGRRGARGWTGRQFYTPDQLIPAARALAREIADNTSAVSVALIRQMLWRMAGADHPMEAHKVDSRGIFARGSSADVKEGVASFLEKRPAKFPDKISKDMPAYFPWWKERKYS